MRSYRRSLFPGATGRVDRRWANRSASMGSGPSGGLGFRNFFERVRVILANEFELEIGQPFFGNRWILRDVVIVDQMDFDILGRFRDFADSAGDRDEGMANLFAFAVRFSAHSRDDGLESVP